MEKNNEQMKNELRRVVDMYVSELLKRFDWSRENAYWVSNDVTGVLMYGEEYAITLTDLVYVIDEDITYNEYVKWFEYSMFAHEYGLELPTLRSWHNGCPRLNAATRARIERLNEELMEEIDNAKESF